MAKYINADVLRKEINRLRISGLGNKHPEWHNAMWECLDAILRTPTADVREVKHGHWVKVPGFVTPGGDPVWGCSECGKGVHVYGIEANTYAADVADHQWIACPNCGAIMDEVTSDE